MEKEFVIKCNDNGQVELAFGFDNGTPYFIRGDSSSGGFESQIFKSDIEDTLSCFNRKDDFETEPIKWELKIGKKNGGLYYRRGDYSASGFDWKGAYFTLEQECLFIETLKMMLEAI